MGRTIAALALHDFESVCSIVAGLEAPGHDAIGRDLGIALGRSSSLGVPVSGDAASAIRRGDVLVEFTAPAVTMDHVRIARTLRKPMVIGTTGLSAAQRAALKSAARLIPIIVSPNMSVGVNVLFELAQLAATRLGRTFDVEVVESHHRHKKDAPSGTAKRLAELLASARKQPAGAIPVHAVRAGDIVGDHTVILAGPAERLELTHRAHGREVFARGALRAAQFVVGRKPGLYDMSDVLASPKR